MILRWNWAHGEQLCSWLFSTVALYSVNQRQVPTSSRFGLTLQQYKAASSPFYLFIFKWITKPSSNSLFLTLQPNPSLCSRVPSGLMEWVPSAINTVHTLPSRDFFQAKFLFWVNRRWQAWQFVNFPCMTDSAWLTRSMLMRMCQLTTKTFLNNLKLQSLVCQITQFIV